MADDLELTITIRAIDDASAVLHSLATAVADDFAAISAEAQQAESQVNQEVSSFAPLLSGLLEISNAAAIAFAQTAAVLNAFDDSLVSLEQSALAALRSIRALELTAALGVDSSALPSTPGVFDFGGGGGIGDGDFAAFARQQADTIGPVFDNVRSGQSQMQLILNNTFNGIIDQSAIRDQIIPELERAVSRGATLLAGL